MRTARQIYLQLLGTLLVIIGAFILVSTLIPLLNPSAWEMQLKRTPNGGIQRDIGFYLLWYLLGGGVSITLMWFGYFISKKGKQPQAISNKTGSNSPIVPPDSIA